VDKSRNNNDSKGSQTRRVISAFFFSFLEMEQKPAKKFRDQLIPFFML